MYKISDEQLFQYIHENRHRLYRFALTYVKNEEDAKDIIQNSILKAYRKSYQVRAPEKLPSWFYRVLISECLIFLRRNKHHDIPAEMDKYPAVVTSPISTDQLKKMIFQLDDLSRTIIVLRFFEEQKLSEIANILNLPLSTVKSKLYKSLRDLRIHIENDSTEI